MSKETFVFIAGILLIVAPYLGIPETWKRFFIIGMGILLVFVGYALRRGVYLSQLDKGNGERGNDSFVETTTPLFDDRTVQ
jgi:hypothetical protein